jgi:hypothetical protein
MSKSKAPISKNSSSDSKTVIITPAIVTSTEEKQETIDDFINSIYDINLFTPDEFIRIIKSLEYKGFNRERVLNQLFSIKDRKIIVEIIIAVALRGPQAASKLKLSNGKTTNDMGIPASGHQGDEVLTLNKILSATADLAAYYMKKCNVAKRVQSDLPGWLQFPSAGSIKLPTDLRKLHFEFSQRFSSLIGGVFQEQIYGQMEAHAYLDERLNLFT